MHWLFLSIKIIFLKISSQYAAIIYLFLYSLPEVFLHVSGDRGFDIRGHIKGLDQMVRHSCIFVCANPTSRIHPETLKITLL